MSNSMSQIVAEIISDIEILDRKLGVLNNYLIGVLPHAINFDNAVDAILKENSTLDDLYNVIVNEADNFNLDPYDKSTVNSIMSSDEIKDKSFFIQHVINALSRGNIKSKYYAVALMKLAAKKWNEEAAANTQISSSESLPQSNDKSGLLEQSVDGADNIVNSSSSDDGRQAEAKDIANAVAELDLPPRTKGKIKALIFSAVSNDISEAEKKYIISNIRSHKLRERIENWLTHSNVNG